jgi:uncharacterized membrane protein YhaH (DUF805 family)
VSWSQYLFSFSGRINRARMWLFYVVVWAMEMVVFLGILLAYAILLATGVVNEHTMSDNQSIYPGIAFVIAVGIFVIAIDYMYLAVTVKRLHDRNKSAWWLLTFFLVPALFMFVPPILTATKLISPHDQRMQIAALIPGLAGMALYFWGFVELYCLRGTVGDNRFGPDPLAGRI